MASRDQGGGPAAEDPSEATGAVGGWLKGALLAEVTSRREQVLTALREAIVLGRIPVGAQLKQDDISAYFGVSPSPVRECLRQLESEGLVEHYPNRGVFVSDVPPAELFKVLLPIRLVVECFAATAVADRLDGQLGQQLVAEVEAMSRGAARRNLRIVNEADVRFHELLVSSSGSYHAMQLWKSISPRIRMQFYRLAPRHSDPKEIVEQHRALLRVFRSADESAIHSALHEHIVGIPEALVLVPLQ